MTDIVAREFDRGQGVFAEYRSEGLTRVTRRPYRNRYVGIFEIDTGRIRRWREYANPDAFRDALGVGPRATGSEI